MSCQHENFESAVHVNRITAREDMDVIAFVADVHVRCRDCGQEFGFRGMAPGVEWDVPTRSMDALEAHLPLLTPTELAMNGPLPGLSADPPSAPLANFGVRVKL